MSFRRTRIVAFALLGLVTFACVRAQPVADTLVPADLAEPKCSVGWDYDAAKKACVANSASIGKLTGASCTNAGFALNATTGKCEQGTAKAPEAACTPLAGMTASAKDGKCQYTRTLATSAPGAFLGDCFVIRAVPENTTLKGGEIYYTSGQVNRENGDALLTLVEAKEGSLIGCTPKKDGLKVQVASSALMDSAAERRGFSFGFLTMPYKYFPKQRSFVVNAPVGGYFGWRNGDFGSGRTYAAAVTLSSVVAEKLDPTATDDNGQPVRKVTGQTNVPALSLAVGMIFDVLKTPRGKPFKAGFFIGQDLVNQDPSFDYRFNRKTWIALQLGYDFTDN